MKARKARVARWAVFGLLVAALSVVAAGCGGGDDEGDAVASHGDRGSRHVARGDPGDGA